MIIFTRNFSIISMFKEDFIMKNQEQQERSNEVLNENEVLTEVVNATQIDTPVTKDDVVPLNYENALKCYTQEEQEEIIALSDSIDVRKIDNVMQYGSEPAKLIFDQAGEFLKRKRGTTADQEVINQVIQLSKQAHQAREDFNLILKEPNFLQKIFLKLTTGGKNRMEKVQQSALTNYDLLVTLRKSCEDWLEMLREGMGDINDSGLNDLEVAKILEKYIIAGRKAQSRIESEMQEIQEKYNETGLQKYSSEYNQLNEGYNIFLKKVAVLEDFRVANQISIGQLVLTKKGNTSLQTAVYTQKDYSMAMMSQQLRNAVLNAENREVLEGQKAIKELNNELVKDVSKSIGVTTEQAEKMLYSSLYDIDAAKEALKTVITSCENIKKTAEENIPKLKQGHAELDELLDELAQYVDPITQQQTLNDKSANVNLSSSGTSKNSTLKF